MPEAARAARPTRLTWLPGLFQNLLNIAW